MICNVNTSTSFQSISVLKKGFKQLESGQRRLLEESIGNVKNKISKYSDEKGVHILLDVQEFDGVMELVMMGSKKDTQIPVIGDALNCIKALILQRKNPLANRGLSNCIGLNIAHITNVGEKKASQNIITQAQLITDATSKIIKSLKDKALKKLLAAEDKAKKILIDRT